MSKFKAIDHHRTRKTTLKRTITALACVVGTPLLIAGCSSGNQSNSTVTALVTPSSVTPKTTPSGQLADLPNSSKGPDFLVHNDGYIAGLTGSTLLVGSADQWATGEQKQVKVDSQCTDLARATQGFSLACPDHILVFDSAGSQIHDIKVTGTPTTAAVTNEGASVTLSGDKKIRFYDFNGTSRETASITEHPSQSVIVDPDPADKESDSGKEMAAIYDKQQSSLTGVYPGEKKDGSSLRIGQGSSQISGGEEGVIVAASTSTNAVEIFTGNSILRKHQIIGTDEVPWGVTWDPATSTVWVTSTAANTVTGYDISSGAPVKIAVMHTIADAQAITVDGSGGLVISSPSSQSIQIISPSEVAQAKQEGKSQEPTYSVTPKS